MTSLLSAWPLALLACAPAAGIALHQELEQAEPSVRPTFAFRSMRDGNHEIYRWDAGAAQPINLTRHPARDYDVAWSPAGDKIAFSSDRDGNLELYIMEADGADPLRVTWNDAKDHQPSWSPDGESLLFVSNRDQTRGEIYVMSPIGAEAVRLTHNETYEELPTWSPDGKTIAFCQLVSGSHETSPEGEIFLMDADGANQRRLTHKPGFDSAPAWSPDGARLAFHGRHGDTFDLFSIGVDGNDLTNLTGGDTDRAMEYYQPEWTADGKQVLCCAGVGPDAYDIWILRVEDSSLRRLTTHAARDEVPRVRPR